MTARALTRLLYPWTGAGMCTPKWSLIVLHSTSSSFRIHLCDIESIYDFLTHILLRDMSCKDFVNPREKICSRDTFINSRQYGHVNNPNIFLFSASGTTNSTLER